MRLTTLTAVAAASLVAAASTTAATTAATTADAASTTVEVGLTAPALAPAIATSAVGSHSMATSLLARGRLGHTRERRGPYRIFANPAIAERNGSSSGQAWWYLAYTANSKKHPRQFNALTLEGDSGGVWKSNAKGTQGDSGNMVGSTQVFSQHRPGQPSDLYRIGVGGGYRVAFPAKVNTGANEFHPTLTDRFLLFTRYTAPTDTYRVMLFNLRTKSLHTLAKASGHKAVYAGQVLSDFATWFSVGPSHSEVFRHRISTNVTVRIPRPAKFSRQYNPSVAKDGTVYYQRRVGDHCGRRAQLVKYPPGGPIEILYRYPAGRDGARTNIDPPGNNPYVTFTVRTCRAPAARATDVYGMKG